MTKQLIIIGAGGGGREIADIALDIQSTKAVNWEVHGFIDDNPNTLDNVNCPIPIIGGISECYPSKNELFVCGVGSPILRELLSKKLEARGAQFINLIHPLASVAASANFDNGLVVYPFACLSVNTHIGKHVLINRHSVVGHDAHIGNYTVLSSFCDVTGNVIIEEKVFLGSHVSIAPGLQIGKNCSIGMGSIVVANVKQGKRIFGNPAKSLNL